MRQVPQRWPAVPVWLRICSPMSTLLTALRHASSFRRFAAVPRLQPAGAGHALAPAAPLPHDSGSDARDLSRAPTRTAVLCAVGACTVAAVALRVLLASRSGLWIDEAQLIWTIRLATVSDVIHFIANHDSHPPLFYLLMRGWLWAFGDTEAAALAPNVALGVALVPAIYLTGSRVFSPTTGLIAAALAACSPLLAWHAAEVRPYSFMAMLCLVGTGALWSALRDRDDASAGDARRRRLAAWAVYVVATAAMILTHNWAWLVWGGQGLVVLAWWAARGTGPGGWSSVRAAVIAQLGVAAACAFWVPTLLHQAAHAGHGPAAVSAYDFAKTVSSLVFSFDSPGRVWAAAALLAAAAWRPLAYLARRAAAGSWRPARPAIGAANARHAAAQRSGAVGWCRWMGGLRPVSSPTAFPSNRPDRSLGLALFLGAPLVAALAAAAMSWRNNLLVPHSLTIISPCLVLAAAHAIAGLPRLPWRRVPAALRPAPAAVVTALVLAAHVAALVGEPFVKSNAREVAADIDARAAAGDLTLVLPQWYGSGFYYYYPIGRPRADHPSSDFDGAFEYDDVAERMACPDALARTKRQLLAARLAGRRVWVVTDRRWADLAEGGQHPAHLCAGAYRRVAFDRAAEIRAFLDTLYGPPQADAIPADARPGWSMMTALLYAPPAGSTVDRSTVARGAPNGLSPASAEPQASIADDR
jgi:4-amino-4-deoxy-L-arabinose transferase-like glycosyltransferase